MKVTFSLLFCVLFSAINIPPGIEDVFFKENTDNMISGQSLPEGLFESDDILDLTLSGDIRTLFNDRSDNAVYHPMEISYADKDGRTVSTPLKVKTRGNFRRNKANCFYPPLLLNFAKSQTPENTLFANQDKLKLVTPCRDQQYVVQEYLVYKLYNLLTEKSFKARLVRVVYADTEKNKDTESLYSMILEDEDQMAARNKAIIIKKNRVPPNKTDPDAFLKMAVFEYLIGNTDWSVEYRHNVKLLASDSETLLSTVPYDFDHAGIVRTPYAKPAMELEMSSVQERRYRGYCITDRSVFDPVFTLFNELKEEIYRIYTDCPHLDEKYIKKTISFLDEFYQTINDPKSSAAAFGYPCNEHGTGNVIIKGLRGN